MVLLGIALLVIGAALLVAEAHLAAFGALGAVGLAALVAGAAIAVDASGGGIPLIVAVSLVVAAGGGAMLAMTTRAALSATRLRTATGPEALVGQVGVVRRAGAARNGAPDYQVFVDGALWRARPSLDDDLAEGDHVVVERVRGLVLSVRRAEEWELET